MDGDGSIMATIATTIKLAAEFQTTCSNCTCLHLSVLSGPPGAPTVVSASKTCINLTWTPPVDDRGVPIIGYQLEKRKKDAMNWIALNLVNEPIKGLLERQHFILF